MKINPNSANGIFAHRFAPRNANVKAGASTLQPPGLSRAAMFHKGGASRSEAFAKPLPNEKPASVKPEEIAVPQPQSFEKPLVIAADQKETPAVEIAEGAAEPEPQTSLTLMNGLMKSWGTSNAEYDYTGDGTVNVADLLFLINHWDEYNNPAPHPVPPQSDTTVAKTDVRPQAKGASDPAAIEGELSDAVAAASEEPAPIPTADPPATNANPAEYLQKTSFAGNRAAAVRAVASAASVNANAASKSVGGLNKLAASLFDQLSANGFGDQPPANIRDLIDQLNLSPKQTDFMLKKLMEKYPAGLGVNAVA